MIRSVSTRRQQHRSIKSLNSRISLSPTDTGGGIPGASCSVLRCTAGSFFALMWLIGADVNKVIAHE